MRLIDADALKKAIAQYGKAIYGFEGVLAIIDDAPTVEITEEMAIDRLIETGWLYEHDKEMTERPHGKWITYPTVKKTIQCSECTAFVHESRNDIFIDPIGELNYCPNCGAKMDKEAKNEQM